MESAEYLSFLLGVSGQHVDSETQMRTRGGYPLNWHSLSTKKYDQNFNCQN